MSEEEFVFEILGQTIGPMLLIMLFSLAGSVFLALCVYNDAKARNNDSAVMWAVLSGFFNIVALVYIIVALASKPKALVCPAAVIRYRRATPVVRSADSPFSRPCRHRKPYRRISAAAWCS